MITTRPTNRIDIQYFKYLPFTEVFSSADDLHAALFPVFARRGQIFMPGRELKSALQDMAGYYESLPDEKRKLGSMTYADYPPVAMDNAITRVFDRKCPNWRVGANLPMPPRDTSGDAELLAEMNERPEWLKRHAK